MSLLKVGIIGDSTVCEYPADSAQRGWGELLPEFFDPKVRFLNTAHPGLSTRTFPPDRWNRILDFHPDFILIQFGHNDSHDKSRPESTDASTEYKDNLRRFVQEARENGAAPILVTPPHRRIFDTQGRLTQELLPYATAMKEVGDDLRVLVIDLYQKSGVLLEALGELGSAGLFIGGEKEDRTHFTENGAREMGRLVAVAALDIIRSRSIKA